MSGAVTSPIENVPGPDWRGLGLAAAAYAAFAVVFTWPLAAQMTGHAGVADRRIVCKQPHLLGGAVIFLWARCLQAGLISR